MVDVGKVERGICPGVNSAFHLCHLFIPTEVEAVYASSLALRHKAFHQLVIQPNKLVCHRCLAESLRVHKAQGAGSLKAVFADDLVDLNHALLPQLKVVDDPPSGHLVENRVQGSSLLAYKGEVQVHLVLAVRRDHAEYRSAIGVPNNSGV